MDSVITVLPVWALMLGAQVLVFYVLPTTLVGACALLVAFVAAQFWSLFGPVMRMAATLAVALMVVVTRGTILLGTLLIALWCVLTFLI